MQCVAERQAPTTDVFERQPHRIPRSHRVGSNEGRIIVLLARARAPRSRYRPGHCSCGDKYAWHAWFVNRMAILDDAVIAETAQNGPARAHRSVGRRPALQAAVRGARPSPRPLRA
jgi:hypothetical protein